MTLTPTSKVTAAGIGGLIGMLLISLLQINGIDLSSFALEVPRPDGTTVTVGLEGLIVAVASFAGGWLKKENRPV